MSMELQEKLKHYRISSQEYDQICKVLGRAPEGLEFALFSALWSEHCSYKSSKFYLKKLFGRNERVVTESGENAGIIDLGEGERLAFKMESHNHPSFIEPYEGAATGVGGILRDIFTMGARPIALANYLCFGEVNAPRMSALVDGVVRGIGGYGNCVGVPTVTGQTEFHRSYNTNILVNALAVGLLTENEKMVVSKAKGPGNLVVYVGAKTGRDGIHGASMASEAFDADSESKKPTIQKGDPFYEKLLIESCMEVIHAGLVEAIQDMGAAGLTSSSFEMAAKGNVGLDLHLDRVPLRDSSLSPEDILLSESQERMLLVCKPENLPAIQLIFSRWDLDAVAIGEVISERQIRLNWKGEELCAIDPLNLTDSAPEYQRPFVKWNWPNRKSQLDVSALGAKEFTTRFMEILSSAEGGSRKWIYRQYDQRVGAKTARDASHSVAVQKLPSERLLGLVLGCRPHLMRADAYWGGVDSVAYPALELSAKAFLPLAVTDCLNFGNPEKPEIMSQFVAALEGMNTLCQEINTPIISGNVSFYNETLGENITPTPSTGLVGLRSSDSPLPADEYTQVGQKIFLLSSDFIVIDRKSDTYSGDIDIKALGSFIHGVRHLATSHDVEATRVVGKFGLPYALYRMCHRDLACKVEIPSERMNFSERLYEVLYVVASDKAESFIRAYEILHPQMGGKLAEIGEVTNRGQLQINEVDLSVQELNSNYTKFWSADLGLS